jgi:hypothetical protein
MDRVAGKLKVYFNTEYTEGTEKKTKEKRPKKNEKQ